MAPRLKTKFFLNSSGVQSVSSSPLSQNSGFSCPIAQVTTCFFSAASGSRKAQKCSTFSAFLWKYIHSGTMIGAGWTLAISLTPSSRSLNNMQKPSCGTFSTELEKASELPDGRQNTMKNCPLCLRISVILGKILALLMSWMSRWASIAFQLSLLLTRFMRTA